MVFAGASSLVEVSREGPTACLWISSYAHWTLTEKEVRSRMSLMCFKQWKSRTRGLSVEQSRLSPQTPDILGCAGGCQS